MNLCKSVWGRVALAALLALFVAGCDQEGGGGPTPSGSDTLAEADAVSGSDAPSGPDATATEGRELQVNFADGRRAVDLSTLATTTVGGAAVVTLSAVVARAVPETPVADLVLDDLFAADGFHSAAKSGCQAVLPVDGELLARGWVDPVTGNVSWDEALTYPGCLYVEDLTEISVSVP